MKYSRSFYGLFGLLLTCPQVWGASAPRVYHIETIAGSSLNGDQGAATGAQIGNILGIALDRWGNFYLSDTDNHRVRRVSTSGVITTIAGTGVAGFTGDGGPATAAQLNLPYGLAVDYNGNLYIADLGNQRVRRIAPDGTITTVAGDGRKASSLDGGLAAETSLLSPRNLAVDDAGTLYISEFEGHRVRRVTSEGKIWTAAGMGQTGFRGDGGAAVNALLSYPAGLALDRSGALYIADSGNNRIRKIYSNGAIGTVLGGSPSTAMRGPIAVTVDAAGTIYTADASFVVRAFTLSGKWQDYAGHGVPGFSGDGALATKATLTAVHDLLASPYTTNLYIADGTRVRWVDFNGVIRTYAGDGYMRSVGDGQAATSALLNRPLSVVLDFAGNLYIADTGTQRVRRIARNQTIATVAGTGTPGANGADVAVNELLNSPMGVAIDSSGNLLIADTYNHVIRQVTGDGKIRVVVGTGNPGSGTVDDSVPALVALRGPRGVCTDRAGSIYIADTSNHRVLRLPPGNFVNGTRMQTVAGNGSPGDAGDGGQARMAQLNQPSACQLDSYGNLYIADTANHRIRKVSPAGVISTVAGSGAAGFTGDEGIATDAQLSSPLGIAADDGGNLYVADSGNHRVRQITPDGVIRTIAGTGMAGFAGDDGAARSAQLSTPAGLTLDGSGALYIADSGNQRIRRLTQDAAAIPPEPITMPPVLSAANALSLQSGAVAPGEMVSIFGTGLGPESGVPGGFDAAGLLANSVAGVEVRFDGIPAPLFYVQNEQINLQVPYTVSGSASTHVEVLVKGKNVAAIDLPVSQASPGLLPVITNGDGSPNGETTPAPPGAVLTLYATGEGLHDFGNIAGKPAESPEFPRLPVAVTIAGLPVEVLYAGTTQGLIGVMQVNVRVPGGFLAPGKTDLSLTVGGIAAPALPVWLK